MARDAIGKVGVAVGVPRMLRRAISAFTRVFDTLLLAA
jgi:hypothetical protein